MNEEDKKIAYEIKSLMKELMEILLNGMIHSWDKISEEEGKDEN